MKFWKALTCTAIAALGLAGSADGQVVISQVYPAGGNSGAAYNADYVELFNKGASSQDLSNWSVQYASTAGSTWSRVDIPAGKSIAAGGYFLVKVSTIGTNGVALTPDVDGTAISANANNGKFALLNVNTTITAGTSCPSGASVVDIVGYGTANCFEGSGAAPATSAMLAAFRGANGCVDTGNNNSDFSTASPAPRNTTSPTITCGATPPIGVVTATPGTSVCPGTMITLTVVVTPGSSGAPIASVSADLTSLGGGLADDFTLVSPNTWTRSVTIATSTTPGTKSIMASIVEGAPGTLTGSASGSVGVSNCTLGITSSSVSPGGVCSGESVTFNLTVRKNTITGQGPSTGIVVALDLTNVNFFTPLIQNMTLIGVDPNNADRLLYTLTHTVPAAQLSGSGSVGITVTDAQNNLFNGTGATPTPFNVLLAGPCTPANSDVVISQVYGGGGATSGSPTYKDDYVELFNRGSAPVDVTGWTLQYASATGPTTPPWAVSSTLSATIQPGQYYLVRLSTAGVGILGADLPVTPDFIPAAGLSLSATSGKIALVSDAVALVPSNPTDATIKDLVGYGSANGFEGVAAAPGTENTNAAFRLQNGCRDTNQNAADFAIAAALPRNSASPFNSCVAVACCKADGTCEVITGTCNGVAQTGQSTCPPSPACPQPTVCCRGNACTVELPASCVATGGGVVGSGSVCQVNSCGAPAMDNCCRGTTCNPVTAGTCTGVVAGSNSITVTSCGAGNTLATCCYADFNHDGIQSIDDLFLYFNAYFTNSPWANFGGDGSATPTIDDLFLYINAYFGTCL